MTNEERDLITRFIERVSGASASGAAGSVPSTQGAGLAPVDPEADALIGQLMARYPEARYRITQLAFVQEHALEAAQQRIASLQGQVQQMQAAAGSAQPTPSPWGAGAQPQQHPSRGFFGGLFGGGASGAAPQPSYPPPPPPQQQQDAPQQYAPQYGAPAGMFQPHVSGCLGGALRTAAGVAGGLVAGQALMNLFEGNRGGGFGGFGSGAAMPGGFEQGPGLGTPGGWVDGGPVADRSGGGFAPDPYDQGGALKSDPASDPFAGGQGGGDNSGWAPVSDQSGGDSGWQDAAPDAGWDSGSNSDDGGWTDSSSDA